MDEKALLAALGGWEGLEVAALERAPVQFSRLCPNARR